jgi:hypothetical protein
MEYSKEQQVKGIELLPSESLMLEIEKLVNYRKRGLITPNEYRKQLSKVEKQIFGKMGR